MKVDSRIVEHIRVPASSLKAHPQNWRVHPENQKTALRASLEELGFARSILAYRDPEWGLTIIDGHARQEELKDNEVDVEVVDFTREEARKALLTIDPLAMLAGTDDDMVKSLLAETEADNAALGAVWQGLHKEEDELPAEEEDEEESDDKEPEQFLVIITCESSTHQAEVLNWANKKKLKAKALIS